MEGSGSGGAIGGEAPAIMASSSWGIGFEVTVDVAVVWVATLMVGMDALMTSVSDIWGASLDVSAVAEALDLKFQGSDSFFMRSCLFSSQAHTLKYVCWLWHRA